MTSPVNTRSVKVDTLKMCLLGSRGGSLISEVCGLSQASAAIGNSSAIKSIARICMAVMAGGMPSKLEGASESSTVISSAKFEDRADSCALTLLAHFFFH